jgi:hypothetical protein
VGVGAARWCAAATADCALIDDAVASPDVEERSAALWLQVFLADHDLETSAQRNMIMVEAKGLLHSESSPM